MIKRFVCLLVIANLYWLLCCCAQAQVHDISHPAQVKTDVQSGGHDLGLNIEIQNQAYCHIDDETFSLQLDIRAKFTNATDHSVILSRRIEPPAITRVAKTTAAGRQSDFEYNPSTSYLPSKLPPAPQFGESPDPEYFVVLSPKESYETTLSAKVVGTANSSLTRKTRGLLKTGDHVLQLGVSTWPYDWPHFATAVNSKALAEKWAGYGQLSTDTILSNFAPFTIPKEFINPSCEP